jgi:hypothetical protein
VSKATKRDCVLALVFFFVSVGGMTSVLTANRVLAWIAIVASDSYLILVLLFAAMRSDHDALMGRHPWIAEIFPRRTAGLLIVTLVFSAVLSGFAGLYVGTDVFPSNKTPLDAFYTSVFTLALTDYTPKAGYGQVVVMLEVVSGVLLIVALFPLLISRISAFKS